MPSLAVIIAVNIIFTSIVNVPPVTIIPHVNDIVYCNIDCEMYI